MLSLFAVLHASSAAANTDPTFTSSFSITCCLDGQTKFKVVQDGDVTVKSKATVGSVNNNYWISIQRENCGFWGCLGWKTVGAAKVYVADGAWHTKSWSVGNSNRLHRLRIEKTPDGFRMDGTVSVW
ncbi:MAG: hypothetical protein HY775_12370 [Acidobacteria bacterium]|nr:hypothetical protein [Acidobacteriota bacterium]